MKQEKLSRKWILALAAIAAALVLQVLPMDTVTPVAYARCPLKGVVEPALAGGGYWAFVHDTVLGGHIAVVVDEKGEPVRFKTPGEAQRVADQLAGYLCTKLYGEPAKPGSGDPPPYFPLPIPPQV